MKVRVKSGTIELEIHWEMQPSNKKPSFVRVKQDGEIIAFEQFTPPKTR